MYMNKEIHVWNLPPFIRVSFNKDTRERLFKEILKKTKTIKNLAKLIQKKTNKKIHKEVLRTYKIGNYFTPLWFLNNIIELFFNKKYYFKLEKEIIAFRGPNGDAVYSPNFPWKEDERIIRIVFRLIGDGHGGGDVSKGRVPMYCNSCDELIHQFIDDLTFFGKVKTRIYKRKTKNMVKIIEFPKVIGHVLRYFYNINFMGHKVRLSGQIYSLPKKLATEGIKVFGDDEGSAKGTQINFYSANKDLLKDITKLFRKKLPEFNTITNVRLSGIKKTKSGKPAKTYYIAILSKDLEKYYNLIGFYHPIKQRKLLHQISCRDKIKNNRGDYKTKELILKSLLNGPKTSYQLSEKILVNHRTTNKHIKGYSDRGKKFKGLEELGLVECIGNSTEGILWKITEKGKTYKFFNSSLKKDD